MCERERRERIGSQLTGTTFCAVLLQGVSSPLAALWTRSWMQSHVAGSLCHKTQKKGGREVMPGGQREQKLCSRLSTGRQRLLGPLGLGGKAKFLLQV